MAQRDDLSLLIATVRAAYDDTALVLAQRAATPERLERLPVLAARHRVEGLAWAGLERAGLAHHHQCADGMRLAANQVAGRHLAASQMAIHLSNALSTAAVDHLFFKGPTLAALAYPQPASKDSCDIDVLVASRSLDDAASVLRRNGFAMVEPGPATRLKAWHQRRKESVWVHAESGVQLDLHDRLVDNPALLCGIGIGSPRQKVSVTGGRPLETLSMSELYAYLGVHGASSAWFRLKWLADLDALILRQSLNLVDVHAHARTLGAGRASALALSLLRNLFGRALPPMLAEEFDHDCAVDLLQRMSNGQLHAPTDPTMRRGGTIPIRLLQALLNPGIRFAAGELTRQLVEIASRPRAI